MKKLLLMLALVAGTSLVASAHGDEKGKKSCCSKESSKAANLAPGAEKKSCCKKDSKVKAETKKTSTESTTKEATPKN